MKMYWRTAFYFAFVLAVAVLAFQAWRPDLLLVGSVTVDVVGTGSKRALSPGGAVTYAAAVAEGLGRSACVVTSVGNATHADVVKQHTLHLVPSSETLTFEHTYTWFGNHRRLRVLHQPNVTLVAEHVPLRCRLARAILVGPLTTADVDAASFTKPKSWFFRQFARFQDIGVMAQGYQRGVRSDKRVYHLVEPSQKLLEAVTPSMQLFLSDVETDPWPQPVFDRVVGNVSSVVVTRGEKGVSVYRHGMDALHIPARRIKPVDTNGAGDTFATTYMIEYMKTRNVERAGMRATWTASRVCLQPQACKPACCSKAVQERDLEDLQPYPSKVKPGLFDPVDVKIPEEGEADSMGM